METYSLTDIGIAREMNQDYFFTSEEPVGNLPNLFIVADGMGGHNAGEFASRFTVETIVKTAAECKEQDTVSILRSAILSANEALLLYAKEHEKMAGMGTTIVAAAANGAQLYVANVGDSRLYVVGDEIRQITKDHSLVQEMVRMGELDEEKARSHPDKNIITRAIGAEEELKIDFFEVPLQPGDKVMMCTDGLTNMIEDTDMLSVLNEPGVSLDKKVESLVNTANKNGGKDNITVIVFQPNSDEVAEC
ncbi:Serine/threonine phosphatase stp [uncultured Roseburia sp.]|uniref:Stp1/IreP family PP2C-type Ser/Thr phosphatase n=1 Tax=Brotonthovivens ammoniilytica TaxID=2981725 RepID=A0ABT2TF40_9FIRM|nr:Stp1/IreP family PP2C-type Ser/Thr phosphatase [Brotonthovivens ammoniilytica]MCU6760767.1 Stp1/IreP family PP2C-type Ser/Thr phosphatase [Brotonthovivens ammoniilytica]SCI08615.1 Serine/threonine phosphatase stp [uncultured Roseburia sp.]